MSKDPNAVISKNTASPIPNLPISDAQSENASNLNVSSPPNPTSSSQHQPISQTLTISSQESSQNGGNPYLPFPGILH